MNNETKENNMDEDKLRHLFLEWRGIDEDNDTVCDRCEGSGVCSYCDTSTWRRRGGGQSLSSDVCDKC